MSESMIPLGRVVDLLAAGATDRGYLVRKFVRGIVVMCCQCFPSQPAVLQGRNGRDEPWDTVLRSERDGMVTIRLPHGERDTLLPVSDVAESLIVVTGCHDEDNALCGWYLRSDLQTAIEHEVAAAGDEWADDIAALVASRQAQQARQAARDATVEAGRALTARQRVQAVAAVLKASGLPVHVEQARVFWECDHVSNGWDGGKAGELERVTLVVPSDGLPVLTDDSCRMEHDADGALDIAALGDEYRRVGEMSPEERAAYQPVKEAKRGGWTPRRGGGSAPKAEPRVIWSPEQTRSWFEEHGIDTSPGIRALEDKAKAVGGVYPKRPDITAMKNASRPG